MKSLPFYIPEAWKRYPFRAEPSRVGHYRKYPPPIGCFTSKFFMVNCQSKQWAFIINWALLRVKLLTARTMLKNCIFLNLLHFRFSGCLSCQAGLNLTQCTLVFIPKDYSTYSKLRFPISFQSGCVCLSVMTVRLELVHNVVHVKGVYCHYLYISHVHQIQYKH